MTLFSLVFITIIGLGILAAAKMARTPFWGVLAIAFFLPFERIPSLDLFGVTLKINIFLGALALIFWLLDLAFNRSKLAVTSLSAPLFLFLGAGLVSFLSANNLPRALSVYLFILFTVSIYFFVVNQILSFERLKKVAHAVFFGALLASLFGLYQFGADMVGLPKTLTGLDEGYIKAVLGVTRIQSFSKEPLYFANYLLIPLGLGLAWIFAYRRKSFWLIGLIVLILINFVLTLSRGGYLGLAAFALVFIIFLLRRVLTIKNIIFAAIVLLVASASVWLIISRLPPTTQQKFVGHATLSDLRVQKEGESVFGRLGAYRQAFEAWRSSPLIGIGLGNFGPYVKNYPAEPTGRGWDIVNNEYLEILSETGILGAVTFAFFMLVVFYRSVLSFKYAKDIELKIFLVGLNAALVGILVQYNFFSTLYIIHIWFLLALVVGTQNIIFQTTKGRQ